MATTRGTAPAGRPLGERSRRNRLLRPAAVAAAALLLGVLAGCGYNPPFVLHVPGTYRIDNTEPPFQSGSLRVVVCLDSPSSVEFELDWFTPKGGGYAPELHWYGQTFTSSDLPTPVLQPGCGELTALPTGDCCYLADYWIVTLRRA